MPIEEKGASADRHSAGQSAASAAHLSYVLGFDGGQTGTTCLLAGSDGAILGRGVGGGLVHLARPDGQQRMRSALCEAVASAWQMAGLPPQRCAAVYLGLTGVENGTPEAAMAEQIAGELIEADIITAANDATSALAGALLGKPGVVVIAGTGAIALGGDETGRQVFSGGWGWLLGDEGSASYLGRRGVLAALRAWDGRDPPTQLLPLLREHFHLDDFYGLKRIIYGSTLEAPLFADLAPLVVKAAQEEDAVAQQIVTEAAYELALVASAVINRLSFGGDSVPVAPLGGVFRAGDLVLRPFRRRLCRLQPLARIVAPILPAACGSVLLALRACGALTETTIARLVSDAWQRGWAHVE